jgi:hypothetical protein
MQGRGGTIVEPHESGTGTSLKSACWQMTALRGGLQKSRKVLRLNFRQKTKQATIADQCSLKPVSGIAGEFGARRRSPHIIIRSSRLRLGEFESPAEKRLLQHYPPKAAVHNFICHRRPRMTTAWSQRAQANFV